MRTDASKYDYVILNVMGVVTMFTIMKKYLSKTTFNKIWKLIQFMDTSLFLSVVVFEKKSDILKFQSAISQPLFKIKAKKNVPGSLYQYGTLKIKKFGLKKIYIYLHFIPLSDCPF